MRLQFVPILLVFVHVSCRYFRYICSQPTFCQKLHVHLTITHFFIPVVLTTVLYSYSVLIDIRQSGVLRNHIIYQNKKRLMLTTRWEENVKFCRLILYYFFFYSMLPFSVAILLLILQAGDVHPNPGPQSTESSASSSNT